MSRQYPIPGVLGNGIASQPTRGFKYLKREHARAMVERGTVRIGNLSEYREIESLSLRDQTEGLSTIQGASSSEYDDLPKNSIARKLIKNSSPGIKFNVAVEDGALLAWEFDYPVYCFSYEQTDEASASLCDDTNSYDSCVEITDTSRFAEVIAAHLEILIQRPVRYLRLPVTYRDVKRTLHDAPENIELAFEKPSAFSQNREGRIVFVLPDHPEEFRIREEQGQRFDGIIEIPELKPLFQKSAQVATAPKKGGKEK